MNIYSKSFSKIAEIASCAANSVTETWDKHVPTQKEIAAGASNAAKKVASTASEATNSVSAAWDKHTPSKERVVGTLVVSGLGALVLNKEELEAVGARTISSASKTASSVSDAAVSAATVVKENPGPTVAGAVVGVGAVAAAPFTGGGSLFAGATLASSLAGAGGLAVATAAVGAGAGAAISNIETKKIKTNAYGKGVEKGKAESAVKIEELKKIMIRAAEVFTAQAQLNEFITSLAALGFSVAASDGAVSDEEKACVEEYLIGMSKLALPQNIRESLQIISAAPPEFETAIFGIQKIDISIWPFIDGFLEVIAEADGDINQNERDFLDKWDKYKINYIKYSSYQ